MGLNKCDQSLIRAVADNDIRSARKAALALLDTDQTQKNKWFVQKYKQILASEGSNVIELPGNLKDIMLCEDVSLTFKESRYYETEKEKKIVSEIIKMSRVSMKLMEMQIPYKNITLLYGPPGTGKTTLGKHVAYKMGLPFCYLNLSRVVDSYMGATSRNISQAFTYASANPCVFMLDEVDSISCNRKNTGSGSADKEVSRITIGLMQEMDRLANDVVVIAATNRLDILDAAFISRCSQRYEMKPFSDDENREMVKKFLLDVGVSIADEDIVEVIGTDKDQRSIIGRLIRKIADAVEEEI